MAKRRPDRLTALRGELRRSHAALDARIDDLDAKIESARSALDAKIDGVHAGVLGEIQRSAAETRRHFDIAGEALLSQMKAEGVLTAARRLDRHEGDDDDRFRVVDDRLLRLEARVSGPPQF